MTKKQKTLKQEGNIIITDPMGSYTGRPATLTEKPVQDADDL